MSNIANITLDDTSPLYNFQGAWSSAHGADPAVDSYFRNTFRTSQVNGDSVTLAFTGTGIACFGAKRENHGFFNASLDGGPTIATSGEASPGEFQAVLFSSGAIQDGPHSLVLTNANALNPKDKADNVFFDLDFCEYSFATGEAGTSSLRTIIDDAAPAFTYTGPAWTDNFPAILKQPNYFDRTGHITGGTDDSVTFTFEGTAVQIMGAVNFNHGQYTASLDGVTLPSFDGLYDHLQTSVPIFVATGLKNGSHTVKLINNGVGDINDLDIDFAVVDMPIAGDGAIQTINAPFAAAVITGEYPQPLTTPRPTAAGKNAGTIPVVGALASGASPGFSVSAPAGRGASAEQAQSTETFQAVSKTSPHQAAAIALGVIASVLLVGAGLLLVILRRRRQLAARNRKYLPGFGSRSEKSGPTI